MVKASTLSARSSFLLGLLMALAVIAAIWFPEFDLFYVNPEPPSVEVIAQSKAEPAVDVLDELGQMELMPLRTRSGLARRSGGRREWSVAL